MLLYRVVVLRIKDSGGKQPTFAHIPRETSGHSGRARTEGQRTKGLGGGGGGQRLNAQNPHMI